MNTPKLCGQCRVVIMPDPPSGNVHRRDTGIEPCPTHAAAPVLLAALKECQRLAIERISTADAAVKEDIYAADALMGIAKTARAAIEAAKGDA